MGRIYQQRALELINLYGDDLSEEIDHQQSSWHRHLGYLFSFTLNLHEVLTNFQFTGKIPPVTLAPALILQN